MRSTRFTTSAIFCYNDKSLDGHGIAFPVQSNRGSASESGSRFFLICSCIYSNSLFVHSLFSNCVMTSTCYYSCIHECRLLRAQFLKVSW